MKLIKNIIFLFLGSSSLFLITDSYADNIYEMRIYFQNNSRSSACIYTSYTGNPSPLSKTISPGEKTYVELMGNDLAGQSIFVFFFPLKSNLSCNPQSGLPNFSIKCSNDAQCSSMKLQDSGEGDLYNMLSCSGPSQGSYQNGLCKDLNNYNFTNFCSTNGCPNDSGEQFIASVSDWPK